MTLLTVCRGWGQSVVRFVLLTAAGAVVSPAMGQVVKSPGEGDQPIVATGEALVAAEEPAVVPEEPPILGCGKSEAAKRWFRTDPVEIFDGGVAEAMGETDVLHNDLTVEITDISTATNSCTLTGQNRMKIQSKSSALTTFTIRLRSQFSVTGASVTTELPGDPIPVTVTINSTSTRTVTLNRSYGMDEVFWLTIPYTGPTVSAFFGSIDVVNHSGAAEVSTLSEPYYAYTWWPVKDDDDGEPGDNSDKATLDIRVTAPNNFSVASNGLLESITPLSDNRNQYHWSSAYPIATYLVSISATNYNRWNKTYNYPGGEMPVEFFIYPEVDAPSNRAAWEKVTDMMAAYRPLFGEYPFINEKYGLYNFSFGGGMEHQTMTGQGGFWENVTAHELAHQWWGDNVTCKTWSDIWLNEGFATYSECLWEEYKSGVQDQAAYFTAIRASNHKPTNDSRSVYIPAVETSNPSRIFDYNLSYKKGAWVLHMLRHVVGDATFFQILHDHRAEYEGSAATTDDFATVAAATYGQDLTWFFDQWVYQAGAPEYRFRWDSVNVGGQEYLHVKIEQEQFFLYPDVFVMPVDIVTAVGAPPSKTVTVWNDQRSQYFVWPVSAVPSSVQFDPNQWILRTTPLVNSTLV
ncbi:MAG: M1 family metallopeptidase, partial [Phycisphaerales bacterium]|nr:M1 family metallopeptidase [Phycisphaerales bacterium]